MKYVHLHAKSHYSMLHALATPSQLVSKAAKIGQHAIALTDFGLCAGFPKFAESCKKAGLKPIFGLEIFVVKDMNEKEKGDGSRRKSIILIARTAEGYRNLLDISSESFMRGFYQKPRIDFAYLEKKSAGLICLTGGIYSHIPSMVWVNDMEKADKAMRYYKRLFGEWLFVEITRHPGVAEEEQVMKSMEELAHRHGVRCVAANDVRYAEKSDAEAHDVFTCLENTKCVKDEGRFRLKQPEYYLKTSEEMCALFADRPEYIQASVDIADSIEITTIEEGKDCIPGAHISGDRSPSEFLRQLVFDGLKSKGLGNDERYVDRLEFELKVFDVCGYTLYFLVLWDFVANAKSKGIRVGPGRGSAAGSLALYVLDITKLDPIKYDLLFERFLSVDTAYHLEPTDFGLSFDLPHIASRAFDSKRLFEICSKHPEFDKEAFILEGRMMRDRGVLETFYMVCDMFLANGQVGNRNKCNSRIAYWMGMTTAAPSDQFRPGEKMTSSRVSPPDVDMDFDFFRREEVYRYLINTYGEEYTCNIGTYNALMVRATLRSVAKAMDLANDWVNGGKAGEGTLQMADDIAKMAEAKAKTIDEAAACNPELNQVLKKYPKYAEICRKIEGRISCGGIHAAGIVVSNRKVRELSPMRTSKATVCSQFDKDEMEHVGLLKFDILALTTLSVVDNAVKMIADRHHIDLDMDALEPDDQNVFKMLNAGITNGIFQMEGYGMTKLLSNMHVDSFEDMIAANAIYRPGPLGAKVDELYCDYKFGRKQIEYPHPSVEPVLKPTYGLIVYQEQVMNVAKAMAGFSSSQADKLRKAIGKKKMDIMAEMKEKFVAGCQANGITVAVANDTWDKIELFGGYGFNRSHAACYAFLAYQTAYLKRYYTIEFMCALMTANIGKDELVKYMVETRDRLNIKLYGPDVTCSKTSFIIEDGGIRAPLTHIKGVGDVAVQKIVNGQPYRDFRDFAERNTCREVNSRALSLLVEGGALSSFGVSEEEVSTYFEDLKKERKSLKYDATAYSNAPSLMDMIMGDYRSIG